MPDEYDPDDEGADESSVIRALRKELRDAKAEAAELPDLRRKVAFSDAGLSGLSDKQQRAILAAHDGDVTDIEGLKATAVEVGVLKAPEPEPQVSAEEQAAHQRIDEATTSTEAAEAHPDTLEDRINKAKSADEVKALIAAAGMTPDYGESPTD